MWLWIIAVLLIAGVWVAGYFLGLGLLWEVLITVAIVAVVAGILLFRRWRALRAARALEQEILRQAELQAATARPDRRAEILALQEQMKKGIAALKQSKLAAASGGGALYSLPWYMIVGPPGAGKTTALRHSGLVFPFLDQNRGGLKGVGGTRNCDWWFTNEAVILDTAGRYATQEDDREEWASFLDMLKRYRSKAPINGMVVAISLADLAGETEEQVEQTARILRGRLDEVISRLQMVVPVYVMFTKADLIAGFVEFWEDLRKSERAQIWGASFPLRAEAEANPAKDFEGEFALVRERIHARAIDKLRTTRRVETRAKIIQFPLEFAALEQNLSTFVATLFQRNSYQETPIFRGFYFSSGTQEGRPLDRVMSGMARAFGLGFQSQDAAPPVVEPKSYFLTDLFQKVMFPDQNLAVRTAVESRRRLILQIAIGATTTLIALALCVPAIIGFTSNRRLVKDTAAIASSTEFVDPSDRKSISDRLARLAALRDRLDQLDAWEDSGAPWSYRFGMYTGPTLRPAASAQFGSVMDVSFTRPIKRLLEQRLANFAIAGRSGMTPELYSKYYAVLKAYLMLTEVEHLDPEWATPPLGKDWTEHLRTEGSDCTTGDELVRRYLRMQKRGDLKPAARDEALVGQARAQLRAFPRLYADYDMLMDRVRPGTTPIERITIFPPNTNSDFMKSHTGVKVDGVYTRAGWERVRKELETFGRTLEAEAWVLGEGVNPAERVKQLRERYFDLHTHAWRLFLKDLYVQRPANVQDALPLLVALAEPEWPYLRLIRTVHDNVAIELTAEEAGRADKSLLQEVKDVVDTAKALKKGKLDGGLLAESPRYPSPMELAYKGLLAFGMPLAPSKPDEPPPQTQLGNYIASLRKLVAAVIDHKQKGDEARADTKALEAEFQSAYQGTLALIADQDANTKELISAFLLDPITLSWSSVLNDAGKVSGAFWEMTVYKACDARLHGRFPFDPSSSRDASLDDFGEFFRPKDGTLWAFYDQNLKPAIDRKGDQFIPAQRFNQRNPYAPGFLEFLRRSDEISSSFFRADGKTPAIEFEVNLHSVSPEVAEVTLDIDGQAHTYKNTPEDWMRVTWPGKDAKVRGARLRVRGFSGLAEELPRMGDFGLFRLLNEGNLKPGTAGGRAGDTRTLVATWNIKSQRASVQMDLRPTRTDHPFERGFFANYRCPSIITEAR